MDVPAFCDSCGTIFRSGIVVHDSTNVSLVGNRSGPCPACGGMGHIPDGVYNFVGRTIEILSAPERTVEELSGLAEILREAREKQQSPNTIAKTLLLEFPQISSLADLLPRTRADLYAFLGLIIAMVTLLTQGDGGKTPNITINQTINQVYIEAGKIKQPPAKAAPENGRNELCTCGSGKKYKNCCGQ